MQMRRTPRMKLGPQVGPKVRAPTRLFPVYFLPIGRLEHRGTAHIRAISLRENRYEFAAANVISGIFREARLSLRLGFYIGGS